MKVRSLLALAALVTLIAAPVAPAFAQGGMAAPALALGSTMPMTDAKLKNVDGKDVSLASIKGAKGTLVVFTCNACPWAKKWESRVAQIGNEAEKKGIGVIAINSNDPGKNPEDVPNARSFLAEQGVSWPTYLKTGDDMQFIDTLDPRWSGALPGSFLYDSSGRLVRFWEGKASRDSLVARILPVLDAAPGS